MRARISRKELQILDKSPNSESTMSTSAGYCATSASHGPAGLPADTSMAFTKSKARGATGSKNAGPKIACITFLTVTAVLKRGGNELGERVTNDEMQRLKLTPHRVCPQWN